MLDMIGSVPSRLNNDIVFHGALCVGCWPEIACTVSGWKRQKLLPSADG